MLFNALNHWLNALLPFWQALAWLFNQLRTLALVVRTIQDLARAYQSVNMYLEGRRKQNPDEIDKLRELLHFEIRRYTAGLPITSFTPKDIQGSTPWQSRRDMDLSVFFGAWRLAACMKQREDGTNLRRVQSILEHRVWLRTREWKGAAVVYEGFVETCEILCQEHRLEEALKRRYEKVFRDGQSRREKEERRRNSSSEETAPVTPMNHRDTGLAIVTPAAPRRQDCTPAKPANPRGKGQDRSEGLSSWADDASESESTVQSRTPLSSAHVEAEEKEKSERATGWGPAWKW